jgi:hypothetical protein
MTNLAAAIICSLAIIVVVFFMHIVNVTLDTLKEVMDVVVEIQKKIDEINKK